MITINQTTIGHSENKLNTSTRRNTNDESFIYSGAPFGQEGNVFATEYDPQITEIPNEEAYDKESSAHNQKDHAAIESNIFIKKPTVYDSAEMNVKPKIKPYQTFTKESPRNTREDLDAKNVENFNTKVIPEEIKKTEENDNTLTLAAGITGTLVAGALGVLALNESNKEENSTENSQINLPEYNKALEGIEDNSIELEETYNTTKNPYLSSDDRDT